MTCPRFLIHLTGVSQFWFCFEIISQPALCRNSSGVLPARERQHVRFAVPLNGQPERGKASAKSAAKPIFSNSQMNTQQIRTFCELSPDAERLLERAMQQQGLSARAHDRILKVARTIADLGGEPDIAVKHIAEAIQYRTLDRSYWA